VLEVKAIPFCIPFVPSTLPDLKDDFPGEVKLFPEVWNLSPDSRLPTQFFLVPICPFLLRTGARSLPDETTFGARFSLSSTCTLFKGGPL